jgi:hypothetical protein
MKERVAVAGVAAALRAVYGSWTAGKMADDISVVLMNVVISPSRRNAESGEMVVVISGQVPCES